MLSYLIRKLNLKFKNIKMIIFYRLMKKELLIIRFQGRNTN